MKKRISSAVLAVVMWVTAIAAVIVPGERAYARAWDPAKTDENLSLYFWEGEEPQNQNIRFYINAGERYILETVTEPGYGSTLGEWSILCLLRGMYTGLDYMNHIPEGYFEDYLERVEDEVHKRYQENGGTLDKSKSTEYSRLMLAMTALGYDVTNVAGEYDFIDKLSGSYAYSYRQGINGPIWEIIALNTGGYQLYDTPSSGVTEGMNTVGKMLDYILKYEITQKDGTVGGWALNGDVPDPDITGMALQALAPYYLDPAKYEECGASKNYTELAKAVERGILILSELQQENGGYDSWGNVNAESAAQVIVALTALRIDPKSDYVELPAIQESCSFIKSGAVRDGVETDNMIDALLTFWERDSGSTEAVGGFKHVTTGNDGGGGSGTTVNAMATDQAVYALIAYDRFLNGEPSLYDMSDMVDGSYQEMGSASYRVQFEGNGKGASWGESASPYGELVLPAMEGEPEFIGWNTKADGSGTLYLPGKTLIMPEQNITLYAMYGKAEYTITAKLNGGTLGEGVAIPKTYTPADETILLPTADQIKKEGCLFLGWYTRASLEGDPITRIAKGSYGDLELYAGWRIDYTALNEFYSLINGLNIGGITISDRSAILRARELYDAMSDGERGEIHAYTYTRLLDAEKELAALEASLSKVQKVRSMIENFNDPLTLKDEKSVQEAREAYDALTQEEQAQVENYQKLLQAEARIQILRENQEAAQKVMDQIKALGEITLESEELVDAAREAYNHLTTEQKELISQSVLKILTDAEEALDQLQESAVRVETMKVMLEEALGCELSLENDCLGLVTEAHAACLALNEAERAQIPAEDWKELLDREEQLRRMADDGNEEDWQKKQNVEAMISALGGSITLEDQERIEEAVTAYGELTVKQKALVENYYALIMRRNELIQLKTDRFEADQMIALIDSIGEVTLEKEEQIRQVRTAYAALSTNQKLLVSNYSVMVQAENKLADMKYNDRKAAQAVEKILAIGQVITMESKEAIDQAQAAYDGLSQAQKAFVTEEELQILLDAVKEYQRIESLQLKKITLNQTRILLEPGKSQELTISYTPADTISDKTASWSSSNESIAAVQDGKVTGMANGEAVITARVGKLSVSCIVQVHTPMQGLTISSRELALTKGESGLLSVGFLPATTTDSRTLSWKTSNPAVAVVQAGKVTGMGAGTAIVTAVCGACQVSCRITVQNYRIHYYLNGGSNGKGNPDTYDGTSPITLKKPVRAGYVFLGWYTDGRYQMPISVIPKGKGRNYDLYAKWERVTKPGKPVIKSAKSTAKGSMTLKLKKKVKKADGYEILCAQNKKFKKNKKTASMSGLTKKLKKLKKGKVTYVKVRAYRKDSAGTKIYGPYSKTVKVKIRG